MLDLASRRHRWDELGYHPPFAQDYLRQYREMVEAFDPATAEHRRDTFPDSDAAALASCVQHRVLSSLPHWEGCVLCND
ncbi:hypothetical protein [Streptomyces sp. H27-D2]|uniref:hypothetical protein n=1 Tax=Streptomyces sp. H27-D2 TaxID=3046304 RepID=UPI002DB6689E|nr:hypothetical protein [Streptomyces sp. H27-D2]MEC4016339.1 hypothetical protein [Streptomyces sp. H27-D2]